MLKPVDKNKNAIMIEFKVHNPKIENKQYEAVLIAKGLKKDCIKKYEFAFQSKEVLIGEEITYA